MIKLAANYNNKLIGIKKGMQVYPAYLLQSVHIFNFNSRFNLDYHSARVTFRLILFHMGMHVLVPMIQ